MICQPPSLDWAPNWNPWSGFSSLPQSQVSCVFSGNLLHLPHDWLPHLCSGDHLAHVHCEDKACWCCWKTWMLRREEPSWRPERKGCASSQGIVTYTACTSVLKSKGNDFQISKGLVFFFPSVSGLFFLWSLAAPVQQQAFGIFPLTFLLSVCLLMALNHSCLLSTRAQHSPAGSETQLLSSPSLRGDLLTCRYGCL